jgi:microcystin-dependent protein
MSSPFVAEIRIFGFNFAPKGWALCNGQLMPISQNTALFSLLGTFYGGDGKSNFALPNLQGSAPLQQGQGPGLSPYVQGESGGEPAVTLLQSQMPVHNHTLQGTAGAGTQTGPVNGVWATSRVGRQSENNYVQAAGAGQAMSVQALAVAGGGLPHNNLPPYLVLNFCIALQGVYPARS